MREGTSYSISSAERGSGALRVASGVAPMSAPHTVARLQAGVYTLARAGCMGPGSLTLEETPGRILAKCHSFGRDRPTLGQDKLLILDGRAPSDGMPARPCDLCGLKAETQEMGARYIVIEAPEAALDCRVATERVSAGSSNLQASRARGRLMVALRV